MRRREKILTRLFWTSIACIVLPLLALLALKLLRVTGAAACAYAIGAALLAGGMLLIVSGIGLMRGILRTIGSVSCISIFWICLCSVWWPGALGTALLIGGALR